MESKRNMGVLALISLVAVVLASGCTSWFPGGQTTGGGPGVSIEVWEPTISDVRSNEQLGLHLEIRNNGDYNNAPVTAELTGIDPTEWNLVGDKYRYMGLLLAPDPESNTQGGRSTADWTVVSPPLRRGQSLTYRPMARVYYNYETRATKPVTFVTTEELRDVVRTGTALDSQATVTTNGPLSVQMTTGNFVRAEDWRESKFQLQIRIDNTGGGMVYGVDNPIAIQVDYPQFVVPVGDCPRFEQAGWVPYTVVPQGLAQPIFGRWVKLWNGQYTDLTCEFAIIQPPTNRVTANFEVKLGYIYYKDAFTQINVKGTEELF